MFMIQHPSLFSLSRLAALNYCIFAAVQLTIGFVSPASADDWPQWLGPNRDSIWAEGGIIDKFPEDLKSIELWRKPIGYGYAGPAVGDGRVFVMDYQKSGGTLANNPGNRDKLEGQERVLCYDAKTGQVLWTHAYDRIYSLSYAGGPRCTPAVSGDHVYALGAEGDLWCLAVADGKVVWHKDLQTEYKTRTGMWGFCGHPLIDGDTLYCLVGGEGSVAVAFDKMTGKEKWRALSASEPGYCPPVMIEHEGSKQLLIWHPEALNSLDPDTGRILWWIPVKSAYNMSCASPRKLGDRLFLSGIGGLARMFQFKPGTSGVEEVWTATPKQGVYCSNSTPLFHDGTIYGCDVNSSMFMAVNAGDGKRLWGSFAPTTASKDRTLRHGTTFAVKNGDRHFFFSETGDLIIAKIAPNGYFEASRTHILDPTNEAFGRKVVWSHPAFAQRCVFARNDKEIVCINLAK